MSFRILFGLFPLLVAAVLLPASIGGCRSSWVNVEQQGEPVVTEIEGRLFDLDPAISWACTRLEMAVLQFQENDPTQRVYDLTTMKDEPVTLTITTDDFGGALLTMRTFHMEARVGRFGDHDRERRLLNMIQRRMGQLARQ